jgi:hypothetical protein
MRAAVEVLEQRLRSHRDSQLLGYLASGRRVVAFPRTHDTRYEHVVQTRKRILADRSAMNIHMTD